MLSFKAICLLVLLFVASVQAQFFTKSSKSIPRMGRRSEPSSGGLSRYVFDMDSLVKEFEPSNLMRVLEAKAATIKSNRFTGGPNEVAVINEQPIEFSTIRISDQPSPVYDMPGIPLICEIASEDDDQRWPYLFKRANEGSGASSAMRASNTERYLRNLASGQRSNRAVSGNQKEESLLNQERDRDSQGAGSDKRK